MLCFVPVLCGRVWYVCCYVRKRLFSSVIAITEMRDMSLYEVPLSMSLMGFDGDYVMLVLRAVFYMLVRNASPKGSMCFRCLMFIIFTRFLGILSK